MRSTWIAGLVTAAATLAACGGGFGSSGEPGAGDASVAGDAAAPDATEEIIPVHHPDAAPNDAGMSPDGTLDDAAASSDSDAAPDDDASQPGPDAAPEAAPDDSSAADGAGDAPTGATDASGALDAPADVGGNPDAGVPTVASAGGACARPGATACAGNDSQVVLVCQGGTWQASAASCPSTQRCDTRTGACANVAPGCVGLAPGATFCSGTGAAEVEQCGVDLVTTSIAATCGARQTCTGTGGHAACTCSADATCSAAGPTCSAAGALVTCAVDSSGCAYAASSSPCTGGACYGSAGAAQCCTDECPAAGGSCKYNVPITCAGGPHGCLVQTTGAPCAVACAAGACTDTCGPDAGTCAQGQCCSSGACSAAGGSTCALGDGTCYTCPSPLVCALDSQGSPQCGCNASGGCDPTYEGQCLLDGGALGTCGCTPPGNGCAYSRFGTACINGGCGCNSESDCAAGECCDGRCLGFGASGPTHPGQVCDNGSWVSLSTAGAPCFENACTGGLCCDKAIGNGSNGPPGQCEAISCPAQDHNCGDLTEACCSTSVGPACYPNGPPWSQFGGAYTCDPAGSNTCVRCGIANTPCCPASTGAPSCIQGTCNGTMCQ